MALLKDEDTRYWVGLVVSEAASRALESKDEITRHIAATFQEGTEMMASELCLDIRDIRCELRQQFAMIGFRV